ncbi:hypothetical protein DSCO28_33400 [Desulfosarcina ovata subsp. sediminis]|uniref:SGNH hydrolase-type esterase domain-containing protein n=1 Tax=Desulfosarcina ovata subsp. sediminis TaxID=885957 RepID=A0A5K7ZMJ1_9BACT|nr:hypothetical protein DSCO28_33400 [Desulfosarcina ovata subsp. sediminis]
MAGMGPLDFILYQDYIKNCFPKTILLYLSDFDLCKAPNLSGATLAPFQSISKVKNLFNLVWNYGLEGDFAEFFISNYLPEYRFQFIFKGVVNKLFGKSKATPHPDTQLLEKHNTIDSHIDALNDKLKNGSTWVDINLKMVEIFLQWCDTNRIKVIIIEGDYHPKALRLNLKIHKTVSEKIRQSAEKFHADYIDREDLLDFNESDFSDAVHVNAKAGYTFTERLIRILDALVKSKKFQLGVIPA